MNLQDTFGNTFFGERWLIFEHTKSSASKLAWEQIIFLYGLRTLAIIATALIWISITLSTGIFTVSLVVFLGVLIGSSHFLLGKGNKHFHLPSALLLTICGGLICNVLAGLAFFSQKMGVSYSQVLTSQRFPEDLQRLGYVFLDSLRPQDVFYYGLAIAIVVYFAHFNCQCKRTAGKLIEVAFPAGRVYRVGAGALNSLLTEKKITKFKRSDGWAVVGTDCLRQTQKRGYYTGNERRTANFDEPTVS